MGHCSQVCVVLEYSWPGKQSPANEMYTRLSQYYTTSQCPGNGARNIIIRLQSCDSGMLCPLLLWRQFLILQKNKVGFSKQRCVFFQLWNRSNQKTALTNLIVRQYLQNDVQTNKPVPSMGNPFWRKKIHYKKGTHGHFKNICQNSL